MTLPLATPEWLPKGGGTHFQVFLVDNGPLYPNSPVSACQARYNLMQMETRVKGKLDKFFSKYKSQKYKKGEILIRANTLPAEVFYLKEGVVKLAEKNSGY